MRIYFSATMYPKDVSDFRGVFIRHMVYALARQPSVQLIAWTPPGTLPNNVTAATLPAESDWLESLLLKGGISHMMRNGGFGALLAPLKLLRMLAAGYRRYPEIDIYHINWLQTALPLPANGKPALITVLGNDLKLLRMPFVRSLMRRVMRSRKIAICPNAEWMEAPLREAFGDVAKIVPISFGIDPVWYSIEREIDAKQPARWLVVARLTAEKLGPLFEWSQPLFDGQKRELHLFGPMEQDIQIPDWVHYHGPASPEQLAREWFPQAHGLITLSRHAEGRPQVMLEAMAAGLPIIASRMPAHESILTHDETGLLCDSSQSYAEAMTSLEDVPFNLRIGAGARSWVASVMGTWDDCANRYRRIYEQLLGDGKHA